MSKKLMRKKLALMLANLKKKRPYYCEVEWIKSSTNNCAINTGIYPDMATIKVECRAIKFTSVSLFGEIDINARFNLTGSGPNNYCYYGNSSSQVGAYAPVDASLPYTFVLDRGTFYLDGVQKGGSLPDTTGTAQYPIALFCRFNNSSLAPNDSGIHTIYYCKIWNGGSLVRDMIPVLDWDYVPCFYDKVSGQLFYNQGTGTFTYGREIHYVDYLEGTGTQYIDSGYCFTSNNYKVETKFNTVNVSSVPSGSAYMLYGGHNSASNANALGSNSSYPIFFQTGNRYAYSNNPLVANTDYTVEAVANGSNISLTVNGSTFTDTGTNTLSTINYYIFAYNDRGTVRYIAPYKIYYMRYYNDGTLVRDFVPCIDENGVGFMLDRVTHTIYDNAGTGVFKYPARETEYLEVTTTSPPSSSACLDLGLKYKSSMSIKMKYCRTAQGDSGSVLPLSCTTTAPLVYLPALNVNAKTDRFVWRRPPYAEQLYNMNFDSYPQDDIEVFVDAINDKLYINDVEVKSGMIAGMHGYEDPYESATNLLMLSLNGNYGGLGKVYYVQLYDTTQVYRDLVPAFKDGEFGMYDKEHDVLYTNTRQGTIVSGKIVEAKYE